MRNFVFDDEYDDIEPIKFKIGDKDINFPNIEQYTLLFAFDYISLKSTKYCFNNPNITLDDFKEIYNFKKKVSSITIKSFIEDSNMKYLYRFHDINIYQKKFLIAIFQELLGRNIDVSKLPTLYQFAIYTDNVNKKAPRIVGFFGKMGVFHVLLLDYEHSIYSMQI